LHAVPVQIIDVSCEHGAIQKEQGAQCLVLGRGGDVVMGGEGRQDGNDLAFPHGVGVAFVVKHDEAADPGCEEYSAEICARLLG
jgi:hypothetical protein